MYSNILVPVAPDHGQETERSMAVARKLLAPGGRITVFTVIEEIPSYVAQYLPANQADLNRREMEDTLRGEFGGADDVSVMVRNGHAAQAILDAAEQKGHDCIIIASHRPGLQDYFLGSTAARVVRHAMTAVHVLR